MAKGDDVYKVLDIRIKPKQQVCIEYSVGVEGSGGVFHGTGHGILTVDWPEFVAALSASQRSTFKDIYGIMVGLLSSRPINHNISGFTNVSEVL
jgi:hypothetical protein